MGAYQKPVTLKYGVPQGSVNGPKLFICYTRDIATIAPQHDISVQLYADDTQLYTEFDPSSASSTHDALRRLELCIAAISKWMLCHKLKLNEDKTEFLVVSSPRMQPKCEVSCIRVGDCMISCSPVARNLGVMFDNNMSMVNQIKAVRQSSFYSLRQVGQIRKYLTDESAAIITHALISSKLDNNNALLHGLPDYLIDKLQRVQNCAARIIARPPKRAHVSPILCKLHWLPMNERIQFKILLLVYKIKIGQAPKYLQTLVNDLKAKSNCELRSSKQDQLEAPTARTETYGNRLFSFTAPRLWNQLPYYIKTASSISCFKKYLKRHLFRRTFDICKLLICIILKCYYVSYYLCWFFAPVNSVLWIMAH